MFDLRKIFDLRQIFAVPKNFLKSKIYCNAQLYFGSAGAVCSIKESCGPQNQRVHIVLKASKSACAKGDVPKICGCVHPLHPC